MMIHLDMDGVLVIFEKEWGGRKAFCIPDSHIFLGYGPDEYGIGLANRLVTRTPHEIEILTRIWNEPSMLDEWTKDKKLWLKRHCRFKLPVSVIVDDRHAKSARLDGIPAGERHEHVLIDDDANILLDWEAAGGTGIQYIQSDHVFEISGIWNGPVICRYDPLDGAMRTIESAFAKRRAEPQLRHEIKRGGQHA